MNSQPSADPRSVLVISSQQEVRNKVEKKNTAETGPAEGSLFPPEDLIRSVLDLTKELERMGVIEITQLPSGADAYRILETSTDRKRPPRQLRGELVRRVGAIFRRRHSTLWSSEEIKAFKLLSIDPEDLDVVEEYYRVQAGKENSICRTSLLTFLRHFSGEVDRARRWKEVSNQRRSY
jgi:hypothetical protein